MLCVFHIDTLLSRKPTPQRGRFSVGIYRAAEVLYQSAVFSGVFYRHTSVSSR